MAEQLIDGEIYAVVIPLVGGGEFELCECRSKVNLICVLESLLAEGTRRPDAIKIVTKYSSH